MSRLIRLLTSDFVGKSTYRVSPQSIPKDELAANPAFRHEAINYMGCAIRDERTSKEGLSRLARSRDASGVRPRSVLVLSCNP